MARRRLRNRLVMWGAGLVTVASLFTLVAFHVFAAQSAFTLERLSKERTNEQLRYERLRLFVANLSSADTVTKAAANMGMVPGPGVITLSVPNAAVLANSDTQVTLPVASSSNSYDQAKRALAAGP